jgi:hypothetical protein
MFTKKTVVACVMLTLFTGEVKQQVRTFATTTQGLLALAEVVWVLSQAYHVQTGL